MRSVRRFICLLFFTGLLAGCSWGSSARVPGLALRTAQAPAQQPLTALSIGSFNIKRGGLESLASSDESGLRMAIKHLFPGSTFHYNGKLTSTFLSTVNVVVIGVADQISTPITPLTGSEQTALLRFVKSGHKAILFTDNDLEFQTSSNSMLAPFGLHCTGVITGSAAATFLSANPIQSGPAGMAQQLDTFYPGWFDVLGKSTDLANLPNNEPGLAYFPAKGFSAGSGPAIFFADSSLMIDGTRTANDQIAILNALAL